MTTFKGAQPVTFNKENYHQNIVYFLSYKLDGIRKLLYIKRNNKSFTLNSKSEKENIILPGKTTEILDGSVLDCEYYKGKYYVFDILSYKHEDTTKENFSDRYVKYKDVVKILDSKKVFSKIFYKPEKSIYETFSILESMRKNYPLKTDGLIFTPDVFYHSNIKTLKWKPPEEITIDFKVKKQDNKLILLKQDNSRFLYKGIKTLLDIPKNIKDKAIYEFTFDVKNKQFIIGRMRPDKTKSNHISVIISNLKTILKPPLMNKILL